MVRTLTGNVKRQGSVLIFALLAIVMISVSMIPVAQYVRQTAGLAYSTRGSDLAFYAAEAGIARTLSHIFEAGSGDVLGINHSQYQVTEANAYYPFGTDWITLEEGLNSDNDADLAHKTKIFFDPVESGWVVSSVGRSTVPDENYRRVQVTIGAGNFARYAFFNSTSLSTMDGSRRWLSYGENFTGPVHSNRHLWVRGSSSDPLTFNSDVTIVGEELLEDRESRQVVIYNGLKDTDADYIELPSDLSLLINAAAVSGIDLPADDTWTPPAGETYVDPNPTINNYKVVFNDNGTVTYSDMDAAQWLDNAGLGYSLDAAITAVSTTVNMADFNGAMIVRNGNAFVSGTVDGRVTIGALANDADTNLYDYDANTRVDGNIIVDGMLVYKTHPVDEAGDYIVSDDREFEHGVVTDVLGLVAERNFVLDGSVPTNTIIDAHLMVTGQASPNPDVRDWGEGTGTISAAEGQDGAFFVEDGVQRDLSERWTGIVDDESGNGGSDWGNGTSGNLFLTGGVVHFIRGQTGNSDGGYTRRYVFDTRLLTDPPPFYPLTPDLEILRWRDIASKTEPL